MSWSTSLNVIPGNILKGFANGLPFKCLLYFCRVITTLCNVMTKTIAVKIRTYFMSIDINSLQF